MKPEQIEIDRLRKRVGREAERDKLEKGRRVLLEGSDRTFALMAKLRATLASREDVRGAGRSAPRLPRVLTRQSQPTRASWPAINHEKALLARPRRQELRRDLTHAGQGPCRRIRLDRVPLQRGAVALDPGLHQPCRVRKPYPIRSEGYPPSRLQSAGSPPSAIPPQGLPASGKLNDQRDSKWRRRRD